MLSKDGASLPNATANLPNGRTIKENGGGAVVFRATQEYIEMILRIGKYVRITSRVAT
jgi:hypothetical protein